MRYFSLDYTGLACDIIKLIASLLSGNLIVMYEPSAKPTTYAGGKVFYFKKRRKIVKTSVIGITAACVLFAASAFASEDMAGQYDCMGCHSIEANKLLPKKYAPYFKDIAKKYKEKYKDDEDKALALLENSILRGSNNKWDRPINMKPRSEHGKFIESAHAKQMAQWIMSLAENAPATEEEAAVEKAPVVEEVPAAEEEAAVEKAPVVKEAPAAEEEAAVEKAPVEEQAPAAEEQAAAEKAPAVKEAPAAEEEAAVEKAPVEEQAPAAEEQAPAEEKAPAE
ncbi:MAG: hypothetical protein D3911_11685 [Candidatus Electrothrix sp. AW3_4]|nr:hypothetical protein [Candidatus Electrothrix gigas]